MRIIRAPGLSIAVAAIAVLTACTAQPVVPAVPAAPTTPSPSLEETWWTVDRPDDFQCPVIYSDPPFPRSMVDAVDRAAAIVTVEFRSSEERLLQERNPVGDGRVIGFDDPFTLSVVRVQRALKGSVKPGTQIAIDQAGWRDCRDRGREYLPYLSELEHGDPIVLLLDDQNADGSFTPLTASFGVLVEHEGKLTAPWVPDWRREPADAGPLEVAYGPLPGDPKEKLKSVDDLAALVDR